MNNFLLLTDDSKKFVVEQTALREGLSKQVVEKDLWVSTILGCQSWLRVILLAYVVAVKLLIVNWLAIVWWAKMTTNECLSC